MVYKAKTLNLVPVNNSDLKVNTKSFKKITIPQIPLYTYMCGSWLLNSILLLDSKDKHLYKLASYIPYMITVKCKLEQKVASTIHYKTF